MKTDAVIVRYGEISLKGRNRGHFEHRLRNDILSHLRSNGHTFDEVRIERGRIYIRGCARVPDLEKVLGVLSYSPAREIPCEYPRLLETIPSLFPFLKGKKSFRISCQRINKRFLPNSPGVEREIGDIVQRATGLPVNLERPEIDIQIEIGIHSIYLFFEKIHGFAGFPFGTAGKVVSLISGGIDSPVATFLMMKRGAEPILVHYQIWPDDSPEKQKIFKLKEKLEAFAAGRKLQLHIINRDEIFAGRFAELYGSRYQSYICLICKYLMHKKAQEIADAEHALGLVTGDNLAQVASQTLQNLYTQRFWNRYPVYSPLIAHEKNETIALAKRIGTYPISIDHEKGCTPPVSPKTQAIPEQLEQILRSFGFLSGPADQ